jgi:hypothetical protein
MTGARRLGIVGLVVLWAVAPALVMLPGAPGTIRVGGIGLLWWYAAVAAPAAAVALTVAVLLCSRPAVEDPL